MRLFSRQNRQEAPEQGAEEVEPSLVQRIDQVEAQMRALLLEWADVMDKINRWAARTAARERHALAKLASEPEEAPTGTDVPAPMQVSPDEQRRQQKAALRARMRRGA